MKDSFKYAFSGIRSGLRSERNLRVHTAFVFYVLLAGFVTNVSRTEWCVIVLCFGTVIASELINTALEKLCDYISPERSREIGLVKDLAAGAVLVFAIASAAAGMIIFINAEKIGRAVDFAVNNPVFSALIILTVPLGAYLVFRSYNNDK